VQLERAGAGAGAVSGAAAGGGSADEADAARLEPRPDVPEVVDLAVQDADVALVRREHRLVAARRQIDDREAAMAEPDVLAFPFAGGIGAPQLHQVEGLAPLCRESVGCRTDDAGYPAHTEAPRSGLLREQPA